MTVTETIITNTTMAIINPALEPLLPLSLLLLLLLLMLSGCEVEISVGEFESVSTILMLM